MSDGHDEGMDGSTEERPTEERPTEDLRLWWEPASTTPPSPVDPAEPQAAPVRPDGGVPEAPAFAGGPRSRREITCCQPCVYAATSYWGHCRVRLSGYVTREGAIARLKFALQGRFVPSGARIANRNAKITGAKSDPATYAARTSGDRRPNRMYSGSASVPYDRCRWWSV